MTDKPLVTLWQHEDGPLKGRYYATVGWQPFPIADQQYMTLTHENSIDAVAEAEAWIAENVAPCNTREMENE